MGGIQRGNRNGDVTFTKLKCYIWHSNNEYSPPRLWFIDWVLKWRNMDKKGGNQAVFYSPLFGLFVSFYDQA